MSFWKSLPVPTLVIHVLETYIRCVVNILQIIIFKRGSYLSSREDSNPTFLRKKIKELSQPSISYKMFRVEWSFYSKHHAAKRWDLVFGSNTTEKFENSLNFFKWVLKFFSEFSNFSVVFESQRWANSVFWTEYKYEYYSESEFWPNTNTNNIRAQIFGRIRIRIICYSNNIRILNTINI